MISLSISFRKRLLAIFDFDGIADFEIYLKKINERKQINKPDCLFIYYTPLLYPYDAGCAPLGEGLSEKIK